MACASLCDSTAQQSTAQQSPAKADASLSWNCMQGGTHTGTLNRLSTEAETARQPSSRSVRFQGAVIGALDAFTQRRAARHHTAPMRGLKVEIENVEASPLQTRLLARLAQTSPEIRFPPPPPPLSSRQGPLAIITIKARAPVWRVCCPERSKR